MRICLARLFSVFSSLVTDTLCGYHHLHTPYCYYIPIVLAFNNLIEIWHSLVNGKWKALEGYSRILK
jgi:hypothetical protein